MELVRRRRRFVVLTLVAALVASLLTTLAQVTAPPPAHAADPTATPVTLTTVRDTALDPGTGRVFVSGDDAVAVFAPDGSRLGSVTGLGGAAGLDVADGSVWVDAATDRDVVRIDPVTLQVTHRHHVGVAGTDSLAIVAGVAYLGQPDVWAAVTRFDPATSALTSFGWFYAPRPVRIPGTTAELFVWGRDLYGATYHRISTTSPHTQSVGSPAPKDGGDVAFTDDGSTFLTATKSPYSFVAHDATTLTASGLKHQADAYPSHVTTGTAHGGVVAGTADHDGLWAYRAGSPTAYAHWLIDGEHEGVELSPNGDTAYVVTYIYGTNVLQAVDLRPSATQITPTAVVRDVPTTVTVQGVNLGTVTAVDVGGVSTAPTHVAIDSVTFTMPGGVPVGAQPVHLSGPTGSTATSITVEANTGATLTGDVRRAFVPVPGATLTLRGGPLGVPRVLASDADGRYSFDGLPYGTDYELTVQDPDGGPEQVVHDIGLEPNHLRGVSFALPTPIQTGVERRRTALAGSAHDVVVEPTTGRVVLALDFEVAILDVDGAILARFLGPAAATTLVRNGTQVYVGWATPGLVSRVDVAALTKTGSWPLDTLTNGEIAFAGGKVWFADLKPQASSSQFATLDPSTGTITRAGSTWLYGPRLADVGDASRFLVFEKNTWFRPTRLYDASTFPPTVLRETVASTGTEPTFPVQIDTASDRVYDAAGRQIRLSTLAPDGGPNPASGFPARSAAKGGLVAFGSTVLREDGPITHVFPTSSAATAFDTSASRLYRVDGASFVVDDLGPHVTGTVGAPTAAYPTFRLQGSGLGPATAVTIDGAPTTFTVVDASTIDVATPSLGVHQVVVTTPWGSSPASPITVVPTTVPDPPAAVTASVVAGQVGTARVSWSAPPRDGGSPVTGYTVTASGPVAASCSTAMLTCDVTGLKPTSAVTFQVVATNANGPSAPSAQSASLAIPDTPPGAPANVTADPTVGGAIVRWTPPTNDGSPLYGFLVVPYLDGTTAITSPLRVVGPTASDMAVTGLIPGASYTFRVEASNGAGVSPPSDPSPLVTVLSTAVAPGAPGRPTAIAGDRQAVVSWTAPTTLGGAALTGYTVTAAPGGQTCTAVPPATTCTVTGLTNGSPHTFTVAATNSAGTGPPSPASEAVTPRVAGGSSYVPLTPARILDSRPTEAAGPYTTPWTTGATRSVPVAGHGGVPADATAVALNVTVTGTHVPGFLTIWPTGATQPVASSINWAGGDTVANAVTVPVGPDGSLQVFAAGGPVDVIFDVVGAYHAGDGAGLVPVTPHRILDSRPGEGVGPFTTPWGPGTSRSAMVAGTGGVPADATAVVLNVTVTSTTAASFLTLSPSGSARPLASSLNWAAGQTTPNAVTVPVGAGGAIDIFNNLGQAHVIVDLAGWFSPTTGALFHPVAPVRTLDSRPTEHVGSYTTPWGPATTRIHVAGDGTTVPAGAVVVLHNTTVTGATAASFLSLWPTGQAQPLVSNLNWVADQTRANQTTTPLGDGGAISIYNNSGQVDVIADRTGWYG